MPQPEPLPPKIQNTFIMPSPITFLRIIGCLEGISFLLLLFVAMPLKYAAGFPEAVRFAGWAHGLLFVLYGIAVFTAAFLRSWKIGRIAEAMVAALLPFGPFVLDRKLRQEIPQLADAQTPPGDMAS